MTESEPDRLAFKMMMGKPDAHEEVARAWQTLDAHISEFKFNRERAEEIFLFVIDNCAYRFFRSYPGGASVLFPKAIRKPFATELAQEFIRSRGGIESQRPTRTGVLRWVIGK